MDSLLPPFFQHLTHARRSRTQQDQRKTSDRDPLANPAEIFMQNYKCRQKKISEMTLLADVFEQFLEKLNLSVQYLLIYEITRIIFTNLPKLPLTCIKVLKKPRTSFCVFTTTADIYFSTGNIKESRRHQYLRKVWDPHTSLLL